jgi:periplasmic mercuric ion binding protein
MDQRREDLAMNRTLSALVLAAVVSAASPAIAAEKSVTLAVDNMYCSACPHIVKQSLAKVAGVGEVAVSYEKKTAIVSYDDQKTTLAALTAATTNAGYPSRPIDAAAAAK